MQEINRYPVQPDKYTKEEAPFLYTAKAESYAAVRPYLEPRPAGTIAFLGHEPLRPGLIARAWLAAGYVEWRDKPTPKEDHPMKPTKHATTNFRMIRPFLDAVDESEDGSRRFLSGAYMPLCVESLGYNFRGCPVYSIAHYGEQNGDPMRDPDMTIAINRAAGTVDPLTYQNDYMGKYSQVYDVSDDGREVCRPWLRVDLDRFLWQWLKNIREQKFSPDVYDHGQQEDEVETPAAVPVEDWHQYTLFN